MQIKAYKKFRDNYDDLPKEIRKKADKQIKLLAENFRHPSLNCKKIQGRESIWEARVDFHYRMTFEIISDIIFLRSIGNHDEVIKSP